ncbi:MAG TPA: YceI family protein, partial [Candidatus Limnocylindrales bacterium]
FEVEYLGLYTAMSGAQRAGFHATGKINREEFGLTWNVALESGGWLVGKDIKIEIDVAAEEAAPVTAEAAATA